MEQLAVRLATLGMASSKDSLSDGTRFHPNSEIASDLRETLCFQKEDKVGHRPPKIGLHGKQLHTEKTI
jgi:hypothetical protein